MYILCERVENGLQELKSTLEKHVGRQGDAVIDKVADIAINVNDFHFFNDFNITFSIHLNSFKNIQFKFI